MAEEKPTDNGKKTVEEPPVKCPPCKPGLPGWMATFSDMVTLLLTFFILLLSFAKTETAKYEAALGSIRNTFGGNVLQQGEVIERGKSPDDTPSMLESEDPPRPFPIDFLTMEGILDKHEINRESDEELEQMRSNLRQYDLDDYADIYEVKEGVKVHLKEKLYFQAGSVVIEKTLVEALEKMIKMMQKENWVVFVEGHAAEGETGQQMDAFELSAKRAEVVTRYLIKRGIRPNKITSSFYGDTRLEVKSGPTADQYNRRVQFILRKTDLHTEGHKVPAQTVK